MKKKKQIRHLTATNLYDAIEELLNNKARGYQIDIAEDNYALTFKVDGLTIKQIPHDFDNEADAKFTQHSDMNGYVGYHVTYTDESGATKTVTCHPRSGKKTWNARTREEQLFWHIDALTDMLYSAAKSTKKVHYKPGRFKESFEDFSDGGVLGILDYIKQNFERYKDCGDIKINKDSFVIGGVVFGIDRIEHNGNVVHDGVTDINGRPAFSFDTDKQNGIIIAGDNDKIQKRADKIYKEVKLAARQQELAQQKKRRKMTTIAAAYLLFMCFAVGFLGGKVILQSRKVADLKNKNATMKKALEVYQKAQGDITDTVSYNYQKTQ